MKKDKDTSTPENKLRKRAEARLKKMESHDLPETFKDTQRLLHELQVHQIELEIQNEELRHARDEIEAGLARYTDLYDFAPVGYFTLDRNTAIRQANLTGSLLLGPDRSRLVTRRFGAFVADESRPVFNAFLDQVFADMNVQTCEIAIFKEEQQQPLHLRLEGLAETTGEACRVIAIDISRRKKIEAELEKTRKRYKELLIYANSIIIQMDKNGMIKFFNEYAQKFFGYGMDEILEKNVKILMPQIESSGRNLENMAAHILNNPDDFHENINENILKNGERVWISWRNKALKDENGNIIGNLAIGTDITERKRLTAALQSSHDELEQRVAQRTEELQKALSELQLLKDRLEAENIYFREELKMRHQSRDIIGQSDGLTYVLFRAEQVAPLNTTVLILGETGTGKELIAAAIHNMSPRKKRPMITVNCGALPNNLIESELFGREKGAFTGADTRRIGRFEVADGSTICLDEIGEMPIEMQAKLLRVIQHQEFERLGSSHTTKVDVRIIATTNRNLEEEIKKGRFREDLFYRLNVFPITVPPLRQRSKDIPLLVQAFVQEYARKLGKRITSISKETMKVLENYPWPGNVRELQNILERAVILCPGPEFKLSEKLEVSFPPLAPTVKTLEETERNQIVKTLSENKWRIEGKGGAAEVLGIHPSTLRARMHKLGIARPRAKEIKNP